MDRRWTNHAGSGKAPRLGQSVWASDCIGHSLTFHSLLPLPATRRGQSLVTMHSHQPWLLTTGIPIRPEQPFSESSYIIVLFAIGQPLTVDSVCLRQAL